MEPEEQGDGDRGDEDVIGDEGGEDGAVVFQDGEDLGECNGHADGEHHFDEGDGGQQVDELVDGHEQTPWEPPRVVFQIRDGPGYWMKTPQRVDYGGGE